MSDLKITLLTERFPEETFIRWQAAELACDVVTGALTHRPVAKELHVHVIGTGQGFRGSKLQRISRRIREDYLGSAGPRWCNATETKWNQYLQRSLPDVALACFGSNAIRAMPGCKKFNVPLVAQFLGQDASRHLLKKSFLKGARELFEYASATVVLNRPMKERLVAAGCEQSKVTILPIGVPIHFEVNYDRFANEHPFRFLAVGRLVEKKSPLNTLRAFQFCHSENPDVRLTIVGDGPLLNDCREFVADHNLVDVVVLTGALEHSELMKYWNSAHCFVQHSVTASCGDREGWPVSIAEAALHGLPVVSTLHEGIPDEVINHETGFLAAEQDWQRMGQHMLALSRDTPLALKMGQRGRQHILENGNLSTQCKKLKEILAHAANLN